MAGANPLEAQEMINSYAGEGKRINVVQGVPVRRAA
jgi:hypothetical protein